MIGRTISHYQVLSELGGGEVGLVYKAENTINSRLTYTMALLPTSYHVEYPKRSAILVLFFLAVASVAPTPVFAQSGPQVGNIQAIAIDPHNPSAVYAGGPDFIFKSTDGGVSWIQINKGLTNTSILSLAIDPSNPATVYAGSGGGVFKSTDGGAIWTAANFGLPGPRASLYSKPIQAAGTSVLALVIDPSNTATIYSVVASAVAGVASLGRIYKSTDGGASWVPSNTGLEGCTLFPSDPCTPSIKGLNDTFVFSLAIDPIHRTTLYARTVPGGVFKSINSGASWSSVNFTAASTDIEILATDPVNSGTVYAVAKNDSIRMAPPPMDRYGLPEATAGSSRPRTVNRHGLPSIPDCQPIRTPSLLLVRLLFILRDRPI